MSSNTACYDPDGTALPGNYPCGFPNLSTCCGYGWDCLDNGLCRQHGTTGYSQSTCTNPSYEGCLSFCNQPQFDGFGEVSRCKSNGNSWCCAGAAGQGLGGPNCCDTNSTTSLEPYPFSAIENTGQSVVALSSVFSSLTRTNSISSVSSSLTRTKSISSGTAITSGLSHSLGLSTSQSSSQTPAPTSPHVLASPSQTSASSPLPQSPAQSYNSKTGIEVGIPVAVVVVLLAVLAFFVFQNRKFKQRLLQLRGQMGDGSLESEETRRDTHEREADVVAELDLTHYELTQRDAPQHEILGNGIYEIYHRDIPKHELAGDSPPGQTML